MRSQEPLGSENATGSCGTLGNPESSLRFTGDSPSLEVLLLLVAVVSPRSLRPVFPELSDHVLGVCVSQNEITVSEAVGEAKTVPQSENEVFVRSPVVTARACLTSRPSGGKRGPFLGWGL